jgi:hypothetical protein
VCVCVCVCGVCVCVCVYIYNLTERKIHLIIGGPKLCNMKQA